MIKEIISDLERTVKEKLIENDEVYTQLMTNRQKLSICNIERYYPLGLADNKDILTIENRLKQRGGIFFKNPTIDHNQLLIELCNSKNTTQALYLIFLLNVIYESKSTVETTKKNKNRTLESIYRIYYYYNNNISLQEIREALLELLKTQKIFSLYCRDVENRIYTCVAKYVPSSVFYNMEMPDNIDDYQFYYK